MKQDRRIARTRAALQRAYLQLMRVYEEHEITVSMITAEADINRATFYTHFSNKEEFLEEMLYELLTGLEEALLNVFQNKQKINAAKLTPTTEVLFNYIEEHREAFYALAIGYPAFDKRMEKLFHELFTEKIYIDIESPLGRLNYDIYIHYQTKATLGLLGYWIKSNFKNSKEYMMEQLTFLSTVHIKSLRLGSWKGE